MRVVIADDEALFRDGLARLLADSGVDAVGTVGTAEELLRKVELTRPDAAITDIRMPPTHTDEGLLAAQQLRRSQPRVAVLVLSHYLESHWAMRLLEEHPERCGYLLKDRVSDVAVLARALFLSPRTVETHVRHIMLKLGIGEAADDHRRVLAGLAYLRA